MIKHIGFYGHSNCAYRSPDSFIDMIANHYSADIVNVGVRQGSEDRILFELKKTKNLDLAIIFHSEPQYIFLPGCDRDIGLNQVDEQRAKYLFKDWDSDFNKKHHKRFLEKFESPENFLKAMDSFKRYLYHPDIQLNRFYGNLIQIEQFLVAKNIPCIHVLDGRNIPSWFKFSGITDYLIINIANHNPIPSGTWFVNGITREGNILIFKRLVELVDKYFHDIVQNQDAGRT
jgi:hypothetical protein